MHLHSFWVEEKKFLILWLLFQYRTRKIQIRWDWHGGTAWLVHSFMVQYLILGSSYSLCKVSKHGSYVCSWLSSGFSVSPPPFDNAGGFANINRMCAWWSAVDWCPMPVLFVGQSPEPLVPTSTLNCFHNPCLLKVSKDYHDPPCLSKYDLKDIGHVLNNVQGFRCYD